MAVTRNGSFVHVPLLLFTFARAFAALRAATFFLVARFAHFIVERSVITNWTDTGFEIGLPFMRVTRDGTFVHFTGGNLLLERRAVTYFTGLSVRVRFPLMCVCLDGFMQCPTNSGIHIKILSHNQKLVYYKYVFTYKSFFIQKFFVYLQHGIKLDSMFGTANCTEKRQFCVKFRKFTYICQRISRKFLKRTMSKALTLDRTIYSNWSDDVMFYLNNIRKFEVLSPEEEVAVFEKIKSGTPEESEAARRKIMESNQRFIYSVAKQYAKGNEIMDLVEECNIGMNDAIDKFDPTKGMKFISYAVWYIRRAVVAHITNNGTMVRSTNKQKLMGILPKLKERFYQENHRDATPEEIIELLEKDFNVKIKESEDVYDMSVSSISDTMVGDNDSPSPAQMEFETSTASFNDYENRMEEESREYLVERLLSVCTEKEQEMIKMLYGIGYDNPISPEDVAEAFGMTKTRILQIKKNLIKKMQKAALQMKTV